MSHQDGVAINRTVGRLRRSGSNGNVVNNSDGDDGKKKEKPADALTSSSHHSRSSHNSVSSSRSVSRNRRPSLGASSSSPKKKKKKKRQFLWTACLFSGLVLCMLDTWYIVTRLEKHEEKGGDTTAELSSHHHHPGHVVAVGAGAAAVAAVAAASRDKNAAGADFSVASRKNEEESTPQQQERNHNEGDNKDGGEEPREAKELREQVERTLDTTTNTGGDGGGKVIDKDKDGDDDKRPILNLLRDAGISVEDGNLDDDTVAKLPTWSTVKRLYGSGPVVVGLETCDRFRRRSDPAEHFVTTAGTFNTGTNLMAELLIRNCHMPARMEKHGAANRGVRWQVPWGKHTPIVDGTNDLRNTHRHSEEVADVSADDVMAAVTIRDPANWMSSMCRHPYAMDWTRDEGRHCPNLVADAPDTTIDRSLKLNDTIPVTIQYKKFRKRHDSMIHHWNEWYGAYLNATFPVLLIRFEDLVFWPKQVTAAVCHCAGGRLNTESQQEGQTAFKYIVQSAKVGAAHGRAGEKTGYVDAIVRYGSDRNRWKGTTEQDRSYFRNHVNRDLMEIFRYRYPPPQEETQTPPAPEAEAEAVATV